MKYNIYINQKAIIDNNLELDIIDCAILDYIKDFSNSNKMIKLNIEWLEYFWIQYEHFISEMPILWINNKQSLKKRLDKIIENWILEKKLVKWNSTYFRFTDRFDLLISDREVVSKVEGGSTLDNRGGGIKSWSINNNIIYNNINNKNNIDKSILLWRAEEIFDYYKTRLKKCWVDNFKYTKKSISIERILKILKKHSIDDIKNYIDNYIKLERDNIDKGYVKACQYFFGPVDKWTKALFYEDYIKLPENKKLIIDYAELEL